MGLRLRQGRVFPREVSDVAAFSFINTLVPLSFVYETQVVLHSLYSRSNSSQVFYYLHLGVGTYLISSIVGNYVGLWLTDTSVPQRPEVAFSTVRSSKSFCGSCKMIRPRRSWHCSTCGVCILKREHHCMFVGYCVGHRNHRYFILFLLYLCIALLYCMYFNTRFLMQESHLLSDLTMWEVVCKFVLPWLSLLTLDFSWLQLYVFFWSVHFVSALLTSVLLFYHANLILHGKTSHEYRANISFDLGSWKLNLLQVLGDNWLGALLWPFSSSRLPHDGIDYSVTKKKNR